MGAALWPAVSVAVSVTSRTADPSTCTSLARFEPSSSDLHISRSGWVCLNAASGCARGGLMTQGHRKSLIRVTVGLAIISALTLTPLLILKIAPSGTDWAKLSDVSQVYAAFLSAIAVLGVAAALAYQAQQTELARTEAGRTFHRELMMATLNDPTLMPCWAPHFTTLSTEEARRIIFVNLIVSEWFSQYRLRHLTDDALLTLFRTHFQGEVARSHWEISRGSRREMHEAQGDSQGLQFISVADKAFAQATAEGPATPPSAYFTDSR
ncbi:DUF6082 family protein [Streptomyces sp. NPDC059766]|uniref:DUF6082 family protein n=1 Tax=Streptomyces sp. NPDC059766 TaxID=3346940 RepID=UPI00364B2ADF